MPEYPDAKAVVSAALKVEGVSVRFGGVVALREASCTIPEGMTCVVGGNGAGKSTLVNVLCGITRPSEGSVAMFGRPLAGPTWKRARSGLVRTFQSPHEFSSMTVLENAVVAAGRGARDGFLSATLGRWHWDGAEKESIRRASEALELVELSHMSDRLAGELSGGQRKLLELARGICSSPKILLLDEPSAGVSPALRETLKRVVRTLVKELNTTVVAIEHDLGFVEELSEHVVVFDGGRVVAEGTFSGVLNDAAFQSTLVGGLEKTSVRKEVESS